MMYKTNKILSLAPASQVSTGMARIALMFLMPVIAVAVAVFLGTLSNVPFFGLVLGALAAPYIPLCIFSKKSNVTISQNMQVSWSPALRPNHRLMQRGFYSLFLLAVFGTVFFLTR